MHRALRMSAFLSLILLALPLVAEPQGPEASAATRKVIDKMIAAHGGYEAWATAPTMSFDNVFFNPFALQKEGADPWWVAHEVIDQKTRRAYQEWPVHGGHLAYDGQEVWTESWPVANPPRFMTHFFYYFVNLPWLALDENVRLGEPGRARLPGLDKDFITVDMTFTEKPTVGKTARDSFRLFIDPDTHLLRGYEYTIGYGALLDMMGVPEGQLMGPILRIHDYFATVDGLVVPARFHTMAPDGSATYGYHVILNASFREPFDEKRMKKKPESVIDSSNENRSMR